MAYLALYREWRPKFFRQVAGQDHIVRTLQNALREGHVAHAYLFCGPKGTGKTSTAKVLARALNCTRPQEGAEPCGQCENCLDIDAGASLDVMEIDAASNRGIDEVRDLREKIKFSPTSGSKRVYIIDEAHMMTEPAFNALLKTLEEPPAHAVFILATTESHKMPLTILSRCQRFEFHSIAGDVMAGRIREVARGAGISIEEKALQLIVKAAGGGLRDALSVLDQVSSFAGGVVTPDKIHSLLGTVQEELLESMSDFLCRGDAGECINTLAGAWARGKDLRLLAGDLTAYLRDVLLKAIAPGGPKAPDSGWDPDRLAGVLEILTRAEQEMRWSSHPRVILEVALVRCARLEIYRDAGPGAARLGALEGRIRDLERLLAAEGSEARQGLTRENVKPAAGREHPGQVRRQTAPPSRIPVLPAGVPLPDKATTKQKTLTLEGGPFSDPAGSVSPENKGGNLGASAGNMRDIKIGSGSGAVFTAPGTDTGRAPSAAAPVLDAGTAPAGATSAEDEVFAKIKRRWPDILKAIKSHPDIYHILTGYKGWPLECKGNMLTVAFPGHPDPRVPIAMLEANKNTITDIIKAICRMDIRVKFIPSSLKPPGAKAVQREVTAEEGMALFDGQEELSEGNIFEEDS